MNIEHPLNNAPFFRGLTAEHRQELEAICQIKQMEIREILFHEGEPGRHMFLAIDGNIQLHKTTSGGREIVIRLVSPGDVFAEVVLFERDCYPVTARAVTEATALALPKAGVHRLLAAESFRNAFISMLMAKQRYLTTRIQEMSTKDVEHRFFAFLKRQYGDVRIVSTPLSKKDIAAAIGTTPESLSRLIQRLQENKAIDWKGSEIHILSR